MKTPTTPKRPSLATSSLTPELIAEYNAIPPRDELTPEELEWHAIHFAAGLEILAEMGEAARKAQAAA